MGLLQSKGVKNSRRVLAYRDSRGTHEIGETITDPKDYCEHLFETQENFSMILGEFDKLKKKD